MEFYEHLKRKIDEINNNNSLDDVDYIGINIDTQFRIKYKIYYLNKNKLNNIQMVSNTATKLINVLQEKNLISLLCPVDDNDNEKIERYDIKLSGRKNERIHLFLEEISKRSDLVQQNINEILNVGRMRNIDEEGYDFASLYFCGMTLENETITSVKFHYKTRMLERISVNDEIERFDDDYYIGYFKKLEIKELEKLINPIQNIIDNKFGNIYLFGVDYFIDGSKKYKIYIKNKICSLDYLPEVLSISSIYSTKNIIKELAKVKIFLKDCPLIYFDGHALCNDSKGVFSVNLYFKFNKKN